jgi:hypothetical protein
MTFVIGRRALSGSGKRLAGTTACPNRSSIIPSCESQGVGPAADSGEEVAGRIGPQVVRSNKLD